MTSKYLLPLLTKLLTMLLLCGSFHLIAQQKAASRIPLEDPELYQAFFRAHTNVDLNIQKSNAITAAQVTNSTAALYHVSAADLPKLTAEVRKFNTNLGAWFLEEQAYVHQQKAAKKKPDMKTLITFQRRRQRLVMNAHAGIHTALSAPAWTGLYGYINGDFKTALNQAKGAAK